MKGEISDVIKNGLFSKSMFDHTCFTVLKNNQMYLNLILQHKTANQTIRSKNLFSLFFKGKKIIFGRFFDYVTPHVHRLVRLPKGARNLYYTEATKAVVNDLQLATNSSFVIFSEWKRFLFAI